MESIGAKHQKYDVLKLSEFIIKYYNDNNKRITKMRLQEILYFMQAYFLLQTDNVCFIDNIEAHIEGPVINAVNNKYRDAGIDPLYVSKTYVRPDFTDADIELIREVLNFTYDWSNTMMTNLIHDQRPFRHARDSHSKVIPPEKLKKYFAK